MFFLRKKKPVHSLTERILWGKFFGFLIGAIYFLSLPALSPEMSIMTGFGVWLWYTLFGTLIALIGLYQKHPFFKFSMPPLLRGAVMGAALNLTLGLLIYQDIAGAFAFIDESYFLVATWPVILVMAEGAAWGMILDFILTKWLGDGKKLTKNL